jgi:DNA-binding transcriptional regulator YdaS (Cro superfamily)
MTDRKIIAMVIAQAGSIRALARQLGINYQAIQQWKKIPAKRVIAIEEVTGIPREELRPDLYRAPRKTRRRR